MTIRPDLDLIDRGGVPGPLRLLTATVLEDAQDFTCEFVHLRERSGGELPWSLLIEWAEWEGATPVLHRMLGRLSEAGRLPPPPAGARRTLERLALIHEFRLRELRSRLHQLVARCNQDGIPVMALKGAALWHGYYASVRDRPMGDVDLLVHPGRESEVRSLADELGWEPAEEFPPDEAYEEHHHLPPMQDSSGMGLHLEIHTQLLPPGHPFRFPVADLWRDSDRRSDADHRADADRGSDADHRPGNVRGGERGSPRPDRAREPFGSFSMGIPSSEHLLLHNAIHFAWSHALMSGVWKALRDVAIVMDRNPPDWDRLLAEARHSRADPALFWLLHLSRIWTGTPIPDRVLLELGPPAPAPAIRLLTRHLALRLSPLPVLHPPVSVNRRLWEAAMRPRRTGHGSIRPWDSEDKWMRPTGPEHQTTPGLGALQGSPLLTGLLRGARHLGHLFGHIAR